jgi:hypothetical protein
MFRCEGRVYEIASESGEGWRVVEASAEAVREHGGFIPSVGISLLDVRACVEEPILLLRSQRIAILGAVRFSALFGQVRSDPRYKHAANLRRIGRAIPPPPSLGCGDCTEIRSACGPSCARRIANECLRTANFKMLTEAALHSDPGEQLLAATRAHVEATIARRERSGPRIKRRWERWT